MQLPTDSCVLNVRAFGNKVFVGCNNGTVVVFDLTTGKQTHERKLHTDGVSSIDYCSKTRTLMTGSADNTACVWKMGTNETKVLERHTGGVRGVAILKNRGVTASYDKTVIIWDLETYEPTFVLRGHADWVTSVCFSPDYTHVVSGSGDRTARIWDVSTGERVRVLIHDGSVKSISWLRSGTIVTVTFNGTVRFWNTSVRKVDVGTHVFHCSFSTDEDFYATSANALITVWNTRTEKQITKFTGWGPCFTRDKLVYAYRNKVHVRRKLGFMEKTTFLLLLHRVFREKILDDGDHALWTRVAACLAWT